MNINQAGLDLLKSCESCSLTSYPDPGTNGKPYTIGYGATGDDITKGMVVTQEWADNRLQTDLERYELIVKNALSRPATSNQFSAFVCFTYNVGGSAFRSSTLLKCFNSGDIMGCADQFPNWDMSAGKVLPGLVARRAKERELFLTP